MLKKFLQDEKGEDMIEYALLGSFISIVAIVAITNVGGRIVAIFEDILDKLTP
jgi:Flp pilus assembly pilin Flp